MFYIEEDLNQTVKKTPEINLQSVTTTKAQDTSGCSKYNRPDFLPITTFFN